jgi:hypothetical protein
MGPDTLAARSLEPRSTVIRCQDGPTFQDESTPTKIFDFPAGASCLMVITALGIAELRVAAVAL